MASRSQRPARSTIARAAGYLLTVVPAGAVLVLALSASLNDAWSRFGVPVMALPFGDLRQLTSSARCAREVPGWNWTSPTCDPFGRAYNYPTAWARIFGYFGVDDGSTRTIGIAMIVLFAVLVLVLTVLAGRGGHRLFGCVALTAAAISPPVRLALERGNIDVFVMALLVLAVLLGVCGRWELFAALLALAAYLKLYPVGAALALSVPAAGRRAAVWVYVLLAGAALISLLPQYPSILAGTPQSFENSYGASVVPLTLANQGFAFVGTHPRRIGLLVLAVTTAAAAVWLILGKDRAVRSARRLLLTIAEDRIASLLVLVGGGAMIVSYCVGTSFDYRMILLILVLAGLVRASAHRRLAFVAMVVLIGVMWLSYPLETQQLLGDACWLVVAPGLAVSCAWITCRRLSGPGRIARILRRLTPADTATPAAT